MKMTHNALRCSLSAALVGLCASLSLAGQPAEILSFDAPDGETYYAVSLPGTGFPRPVADSIDHVILFDTSASQVGEHRAYAFSILEHFLKSLPAGDRVTVFAVDVDAVRTGEAHVSPTQALSSSVPVLKSRFPAGSTDMATALNAALTQLSDSGSILYIGDGMSTAHLVQEAEMHELLDQLQSRHVPVHTFAVGPNTDKQLLGILSRHTGGRALSDDGTDAASLARIMAAASHLPVFYPGQIEFSSRVDGLMIDQPMPMRVDQETIYLGRGLLPKNETITISGDVRGRPVSLSYTMAPAPGDHANSFLPGLYQQASRMGGLSPLAGMDMVRIARQGFDDAIAQLESAGENALASGQYDQAEQVGLTLKRVDPQNARAESLIAAADHLKSTAVRRTTTVAHQPPDLAPPAFADDLTPREGEPLLSPIEEAEALREIRGQRLATEIEQIIDASRRRVADDPAGVQADLETALGAVKSATDIDPDLQAELLRRVTNALLATSTAREVLEARQIQAQRRLAEVEAQRALATAETQRELRLAQLVDRIRALVYEGWQGNPEAFEEAEAVARMVESNEPGAALGTQTVLWSEAAGQVDKSYRLRSLRADRFLATLYQVELSHVPFPDEPPILYPPAPVWRRLTERRAQWRSVDLHQDQPNEARIYAELDNDTQLEFVDTPLSDAIDFIARTHNITILIDDVALTEVGIATDEPVNLIISNIRLKSALKLLLEPLQLTWVVDDEVMKITTTEQADIAMQTRVYPVGDLVISPSTMMGNVGGGGGIGGLGGGIGGGLGGGVGGGLGGGIGGGLGGGGGFFSVPDPASNNSEKPAALNNQTIQSLKKKPAAVR